jgi:hypothetical protein
MVKKRRRFVTDSTFKAGSIQNESRISTIAFEWKSSNYCLQFTRFIIDCVGDDAFTIYSRDKTTTTCASAIR